MSKARRSGETHALGSDAKSQVTIRYEAGKPIEAAEIVVSTQQPQEKLSSDDIRAIVEPYVREALPEGWASSQTVWHVNPTGKFVIGGPNGDCGLTGRNIIVDT
jgi:S-adenosylmethionine synthetase